MAVLDAQEQDLLLLLRIHTGDVRALGELYDRHNPTLHALCCAILPAPHHADEAMRLAWMQVWSRTRVYDRREGSVADWLLHLARNVALETRLRLPEPPEAERLVREAAAAAPATRPLERRALEAAFFGGLARWSLANHLEVGPPTAVDLVRRGLEAAAEPAAQEVQP